MNLIVFSGSYRPKRQSHQVAVEVHKRLQKLGHTVTLLDVRELDFPLLDDTLDKLENPSEKLKETSAAIAAAHGLVLVSPEHNNSFSGALKNTMDYFYKEYHYKVFGIVGVSSGMLGGITATAKMEQYAIRLKGIVQPNVLITPKVQTLFQDGQLTDSGYSDRMDKFLEEFIWLTEAIKNAAPLNK